MDEQETLPAAGPGRVADPVCGMTIDPAKAAGSVTHAGTVVYFCSKGCQTNFAADPARYLAQAKASGSGPLSPNP